MKAIESFDLKQRQNGRVDTLGKKMSIKARYTAKDDVDLNNSVGKGEDHNNESGTNTTCLCRGTVVKLIQDEPENYYVILACYDNLVGNKYFICQDECQPLLDSSHLGKTKSNTIENPNQSEKSKTKKQNTDDVKVHVRIVEKSMNGTFQYKVIHNMKESTTMLKVTWRNQVKEIVGKMKYM